jgi:hypothetical protein
MARPGRRSRWPHRHAATTSRAPLSTERRLKAEREPELRLPPLVCAKYTSISTKTAMMTIQDLRPSVVTGGRRHADARLHQRGSVARIRANLYRPNVEGHGGLSPRERPSVPPPTGCGHAHGPDAAHRLRVTPVTLKGGNHAERRPQGQLELALPFSYRVTNLASCPFVRPPSAPPQL